MALTTTTTSTQGHSAWGQLEQLLTCAICLDRFRNPKLLPCQHTFCMEPCLEGLIDYVRRQIKCPECRAEHRIPYQGIQGYPTNVTLMRFLELHFSITGEVPDPPSASMERCGVCTEKSYLTLCNHCDKKVCEECKEAHIDIIKREISRINHQVRRGLNRLQDALTQTEKNELTLQTNCHAVLEEIEDVYRRLQKGLKDRYEALKQDVQVFVQQETKNVTQMKENLDQEVSNIQSNCELIEKHVTDSEDWDDLELVEYKDTFLKMLDFLRNFDTDVAETCRRMRFTLHAAEREMALHTVMNYGELSIHHPFLTINNQTQEKQGGNERTSGGGQTTTAPGGLMRSKSDHRLAAQFARHEDSSMSSRSASYLSVGGSRAYGASSDTERERNDGRGSPQSGRRKLGRGVAANDDDADTTSGRSWASRRYTRDAGDSRFGRDDQESRYQSRYARDREREYGGGDSDSESHSGIYGPRAVRFTNQRETEAPPPPPKEKVFDTEDAPRGPLSGVIRLADCHNVLLKLQQNAQKQKQRERAAEIAAQQPAPQPVVQAPPASQPAQHVRAARQLSEDDEIARIKRENKAQETTSQPAPTPVQPPPTTQPPPSVQETRPLVRRVTSLQRDDTTTSRQSSVDTTDSEPPTPTQTVPGRRRHAPVQRKTSDENSDGRGQVARRPSKDTGNNRDRDSDAYESASSRPSSRQSIDSRDLNHVNAGHLQQTGPKADTVEDINAHNGPTLAINQRPRPQPPPVAKVPETKEEEESSSSEESSSEEESEDEKTPIKEVKPEPAPKPAPIMKPVHDIRSNETKPSTPTAPSIASQGGRLASLSSSRTSSLDSTGRTSSIESRDDAGAGAASGGRKQFVSRFLPRKSAAKDSESSSDEETAEAKRRKNLLRPEEPKGGRETPVSALLARSAQARQSFGASSTAPLGASKEKERDRDSKASDSYTSRTSYGRDRDREESSSSRSRPSYLSTREDFKKDHTYDTTTSPEGRYSSSSVASRYLSRSKTLQEDDRDKDREKDSTYSSPYSSRFLSRSRSSAMLGEDDTRDASPSYKRSTGGISGTASDRLKKDSHYGGSNKYRLSRSKSSHEVVGGDDDDDDDDTNNSSSSRSTRFERPSDYALSRSRSHHSINSREQSPEDSSSSTLSSWARYLKNKYGNKGGSDRNCSSTAPNHSARASTPTGSALGRRRSSNTSLTYSRDNSPDSSDDDVGGGSGLLHRRDSTSALRQDPSTVFLAPGYTGLNQRLPEMTNPRTAYLQKKKLLMKLGNRGSEVGCFTWPRGIAVGPENAIVVADSSNHRIQVFDPQASFVKEFGAYGSAEGEFDCLAGVAVNRIGQFIVSDRYNHRIQVFDPSGRFLRSFGSQGSADGRLSYPWGIATDSLGFIYVCDKENHRVQVFQSDGTFVGKFGALGSKAGQLEHPHYIAVSNTNKVIVSDSNNHRVQIFDVNGRVMSTFGCEGSDEGQFKFPRGVAVDDQGYIIVGDSGNNRIQIFQSDGTFLKAFGSWGSGDGEFKGLEGVAVTSNGNILVCDRENHRIQVF